MNCVVWVLAIVGGITVFYKGLKIFVDFLIHIKVRYEREKVDKQMQGRLIEDIRTAGYYHAFNVVEEYREILWWLKEKYPSLENNIEQDSWIRYKMLKLDDLLGKIAVGLVEEGLIKVSDIRRNVSDLPFGEDRCKRLTIEEYVREREEKSVIKVKEEVNK